jgi:ABC-type transporter MlaC component
MKKSLLIASLLIAASAAQAKAQAQAQAQAQANNVAWAAAE